MTEMMRAVLLTAHDGLDSIVVGEKAKPEPGHGEVLVKVAASSLNRVDLYLACDGRGYNPQMPLVMGLDGAGVIEAVGPGVTVREPGERVVLYPLRFGLDEFSRRGDQMMTRTLQVLGEHDDGCMADYVVVPEANAFPIGDSLSFQAASVLPTAYLTGWRMITTAGDVSQDDWVLIHGIGGGVSMATLQFCNIRNARTIVTSSSDEKLEEARRQGAEVLVNYKTQDVLGEVKRATGGRGVDVVVENVGEATWPISLRAVVPGGRIVCCGATSGPGPNADLQRVFIRQIQIHGVTLGNYEEFRTLIDAAERKLFEPYIDRFFPIAEAKDAFARLHAQQQTGKVGLTINEDLGP